MNEWDFRAGPRGLNLRVCEWGDADSNEVVLLLHGFLEQGFAWDAVARQLPGRVVAPDHRGHGRSDHVGPGGFYHFMDYVSDVDALVAALGGSVHLVGHSMGGTVSSYFAGLRPDAVRTLTLIEGLGPPDGGAMALARHRRHLDDRLQPPTNAVLPDLDAAVARMTRHNPRLDPALARRLAQRVTEPVGGGVRWTWDPLHRARNAIPFEERRFLPYLHAITAPVLLIDGSDSPFAGLDVSGRVAALPRAEHVIIEGSGHHPHHDAPDVLAAHIRRHITGEAT